MKRVLLSNSVRTNTCATGEEPIRKRLWPHRDGSGPRTKRCTGIKGFSGGMALATMMLKSVRSDRVIAVVNPISEVEYITTTATHDLRSEVSCVMPASWHWDTLKSVVQIDC